MIFTAKPPVILILKWFYNMEVKYLGLQPYIPVWEAMKTLTTSREVHTPDELWILEHPPVYTQGQAGKPEHVFNPQNIEIVQTDRGGQVTYHGPGQLVAYILMDLKRSNMGIKTLVCHLEKLLIDLLATYDIKAHIQTGAPGVYVQQRKIASIGLRVKNNCTYHGIALNVNMDLTPFSGINPCGFANLEMTQIAAFIPDISMDAVQKKWGDLCLSHFGQTLTANCLT